MILKYNIRINPMVISDVQEMKAYISEDNPEAAKSMSETIFSRIESLATFSGNGCFPSSKNAFEHRLSFPCLWNVFSFL